MVYFLNSLFPDLKREPLFKKKKKKRKTLTKDIPPPPFLSFFFFFLFLSSSKSTLDFKRRNARRENEQKGEFSWASASHTNPLLHATPFNYVTLISRMHVTWIARFHERLRLLVHFSIFLSSMNPIFRIWPGEKNLF